MKGKNLDINLKKVNKLMTVFVTAMLMLSVFTVAAGSLAAAGTETISDNELMASDDFAGGDGSESDPYQISNWTHLNNTRNYLGANFTLVADLDETTEGYSEVASGSANGGKGFAPIAPDSYTPFNGTFDGNGYTISNLIIDRPDVTSIGLFGNAGTNAEITNTSLKDVNVTGKNYVGALVGYNFGTVDHSYATGSVSGSDYVGGLVGRNRESGALNNSYATGDVSGNNYVGGLSGENFGQVNQSYATGNVTGPTMVGGLVGLCSGPVTESYATGAVTGDLAVGGLIGSFYTIQGLKKLIRASNSSGPVTGSKYVGGLVGANGIELQDRPGGTIENSTASGNVTVNESATAPTQFGGLVGQNYKGTITTSTATGDVLAGDATDVGGLVGYSNATGTADQINKSYATGDVTGNETVGGLIGMNIETNVTQTYATGNVTGNETVGGLIGLARNFTLRESYAVGRVDATENTNVSGLVGDLGDNVETPGESPSYYDTDTTNQSGYSYETGGNPLPTGMMTGYSGLVSMNFNYSSAWNIVNANGQGSYPYLQDNPQTPRPGIRTLYPSGNGSAADPYPIENWTHLDNVRMDPVANFELVNDLDLETSDYDPVASPSANDGHGFEPISSQYGFVGTFDGQNHTISDLTIDRPSEDNVGLFGVVKMGYQFSGTVRYVNLESVDVTGKQNVGGVAGSHQKAQYTIESVSVSGTVTGSRTVGGLVGYNDGRIENSTFDGTVKALEESTGGSFGGLVGMNNQFGTIANSTSTAAVNVTLSSGGQTKVLVGGLVGYNSKGTVTASNAMGDVNADLSNIDGDGLAVAIGGFVGYATEGSITHSSACGNVSVSLYNSTEGMNLVGGFAGSSPSLLSASNAAGDVEVSANASAIVISGGLVGYNTATMNQSYSTGDVTASSTNTTRDIGAVAGGNVGTNGQGGTVNASYATGSVSASAADGNSIAGGLAGMNQGSLNNSYTVGDVTGDDEVGGLVANNSGTVGDSYWNTETTGQSGSDGGTGLTSSEMKGSDATDNMNFDFTDTWGVVSGNKISYPYLQNNTQDPAPGLELTGVGSVEIEPSSDQTITAGETIDFSASAYDESGNLITDTDSDFTWQNTDDTGLFDKTTAGQYDVKATMDSIDSAVITVTVEPADVDTVEITPSADQTITAGETIDFNATAEDQYGNLITEIDSDFTWQNTSNMGLFDNTTAGQYDVKATMDSIDSAVITVTVESASVNTVEISPSSDQTIKAGETIDFSASAYDESGNLITDTDSDFTWQNTDDTGLFDKTTAGQYDVKATMNSVDSTVITVTVEAASVDTVEISPSSEKTIKAGETIDFNATAYDQYDNLVNTDDTNFTWQNTTDTGLFDKTTAGQYDVKATMNNVDSATITVTVEPTEYDLTINIDGEGSTSPAEGSHTYEEGNKVTITATPAEGWYFSNWTGDYEGTSQEISITMNSEKEITANFEEEVSFQVDITDYDQKVVEGEEVTVEYTVENNGEIESTQDIVLMIDGENTTVKEDLTLAPGESSTEEYTWIPDDPGEYSVGLPGDDPDDLVQVTVDTEYQVDLTDIDESVEEGEEVTVEYTVENPGETESSQDIVLLINGEKVIVEEGVTLEPGETYSGQYKWTPENVGDIEVGVPGDDSGDFNQVTVEKGSQSDNLWIVILLLVSGFAAMLWLNKDKLRPTGSVDEKEDSTEVQKKESKSEEEELTEE